MKSFLTFEKPARQKVRPTKKSKVITFRIRRKICPLELRIKGWFFKRFIKILRI